MYCPSENDSITTSQAKPLQLITCGKVVYSGAEQFGTILVSLASSPPASDQSSLFIHRRVLARTRSSLHDRVIQLPQEFYTVSPVAEIRFIWFSRPFCLFSIIPHKNQKLWLFFFFCLTTDWRIAPKRTGPRAHCYRGTCRDLTSWFNYWLALNL